MRGPGPTTRSPRVRVHARGATVAAFVALAPLLPASAVAVGTLKVDTALPYVCTLPSGQQAATVRITAAFPERAAVGEEIRPTDVTTTVELPAGAVADLTALKAAAVRAETRLAVGVAQNEKRAEATWSGTSQPVAVPAEGPLVLTTTGDVPSLTTDVPGDLTLVAGAFAVDLAPSTADGAATIPASLSVTCAPGPDAGERMRLVTLPVGADAPTTEPTPPPTSSAVPSPSAPSSGPPAPSLPADRTAPTKPETTNGTSGAPKGPRVGRRTDESATAADGNASPTPATRPAAPPCLTENPTPMSLSAYVTGYTNVRKLKGASLLPLSCMLIEQGLSGEPPHPAPPGEINFFVPSTANLSYQGRKQTPPFTSTFLTFDFQPVTATMVLEQTGPITVEALLRIFLSDFSNFTETVVRAPLVLRVLDVKVNGVELDVGPSCRTAQPLTSTDPDPARHPGKHLVLLGKGQLVNGTDAVGYLVSSGGPLTGETTIPAFEGCGADGEDLDRLLTASISGPGNYVKQIQGQTCAVDPNAWNPLECTEDSQPLVIPKPER
ncbi:DUF6801 domain-containing protein [Streptomyces sp. NPDC007872]|uniref:DUF6801 domain-containing protein n=1 Tax=Streptomyces sp. NPDC007872 TaxID=3364782 RepID=UPI00369F7D70